MRSTIRSNILPRSRFLKRNRGCTPYLFVYGTLRKGIVNKAATMLSQCAGYAGPAVVRGRLYRLAHYPGLVLSGGAGDWVWGDVYAIDHPLPMFRILDTYEGRTAPREFERTTASVLLESGELVEAWVYVYARSTFGRRRIVSGDFLKPWRRQHHAKGRR